MSFFISKEKIQHDETEYFVCTPAFLYLNKSRLERTIVFNISDIIDTDFNDNLETILKGIVTYIEIIGKNLVYISLGDKNSIIIFIIFSYLFLISTFLFIRKFNKIT